MEGLVQLGTTFNQARLLANAAPFDVYPDGGVTLGSDRLDHIDLGHIDDQVAQFLFDLLKVARLLELRLTCQLNDALDRCRLEELFSLVLRLVYLHLSLELSVEDAEKIDTFGDTERF